MAADTRNEGAQDRLAIATMVIVHAADREIVATNEVTDLGIDVDVGPLGKQPQSGREMGGARPSFPGQGTGEDRPADRPDILDVREQAQRMMVGHVIGPIAGKRNADLRFPAARPSPREADP